MTEREQLEWAAKACGYEVIPCEQAEDGGIYVCTPGAPMHANGFNRKDERHFAPHVDQADSDRMACKLRIEIVFLDGRVQTRDPRTCGVSYFAHNKTAEDVCRAVREARMLVAVLIGESME